MRIFFHTFFQADYKGEQIKCNGLTINPRCVCAYGMYTLDILDICKKTAPRENGSLDNVDGKINSAYSLVEKFP